MKAGLAGVALAAVMVFSLVGRAEAYFITVNAGAEAPSDLSVYTSFSFDTHGNVGAGYFQTDFLGIDGMLDYYVSSEKISGSFGRYSCGRGCYALSISAIFNDVYSFSYDIQGNILPDPPFVGSFPVSVTILNYTQISPDGSFGTYVNVNGFENSTLVNAGYSISIVPLESSAPLFGIALLALGGLGYARRRTIPHG